MQCFLCVAQPSSTQLSTIDRLRARYGDGSLTALRIEPIHTSHTAIAPKVIIAAPAASAQEAPAVPPATYLADTVASEIPSASAQNVATWKLNLHAAVWDNSMPLLHQMIASPSVELENVDVRGNTALHLALKLDNIHAARALIAAGANPLAKDADGWRALPEAARLPSPALHEETIRANMRRVWTQFEARAPKLQAMLETLPDFELDIHWELSTWMPLVGRAHRQPSTSHRRPWPPPLRMDLASHAALAQH